MELHETRCERCERCEKPWQEPPFMPGIQRPGYAPWDVRPVCTEHEVVAQPPMPPHPMRPYEPAPFQQSLYQPVSYQPMPYRPVPYHMVYPYDMNIQESVEDEQDMERLVSMFPKTARRIQPMVEEACDRMEYDGSLMFDEYPDKVTVERVVEGIFVKMQEEISMETAAEEQGDITAAQCPNCRNPHGDGLRELVAVMLFEEMHRRRCRRRRCKRWW